MLRSVIQRSTYQQYGLCVPRLRFVCAFCQQTPRRLNSTATVHNLNEGPSKPDHDAVNALLQKGIGDFGKPQSCKGKRKDKASEAPEVETQEKPVKEEKHAKEAKPAKEKNTTRRKVSKVAAEYVGKPKKKQKIVGMSLRSAMSPRGTTVLSEESGLYVHDLEIEPVPVENQPDVASLSHGLDRVLFNPGVVYLQDPRSRVFNFDPYLQQIMPITEFDFDATTAYITSSRDTKLEAMMKEHGKKYMGSTSSMTSVLSHFHYLLSAWRPLNLDILSKSFTSEFRSFTQISKLPTSIFLRYKGDGTYAIDSDKEWDGENILSFMGRSMEKMLTLPPKAFEKYHRDNSHTLSEEDRNAPETYHYSTFGDFMMRSQLDAHDPRLPGTGMFDLKTRAVVAIRVDVSNFPLGAGYQIKTRTGSWESFEREYFDMIRAAFLKYSMQVRMGRMDGIFVAFHNTEKIFGFQYISLDEMDAAIHEGPNSGIGEQEFKMSLLLLNRLLNQAVEKFPEKSLRIHFETRETTTPYMYVFAQPMGEEEIEEIQQGERGTVEEFMEKIKEKRRLAVEAHEATASEIGDLVPEKEPTISETDGLVLRSEEPTTSETEDLELQSEGSTTSETEQEATDAAAEELASNEIGADMESGDEIDEAFLQGLQDQKDEDVKKELFAVTLSIRNFVNRHEVLRLNHLNKEDKWEVQYSVGKFSSTQKAWSVYHAMRERQRKAAHSRLRSADPEELGSYHQYIRTLSSQGRNWEKHQNTLDVGKERIVYKSRSQD